MGEIELKAVVFDMDGTLFDSEGVYDEVFDHWMWQHKIPKPVQAKINAALLPGITWDEVFAIVNQMTNKKFNAQIEREKLSDQIIQYVLDVGVNMKPGARAAVEKLAQRYQLGICTSSIRRVAERVLRHHGMFEYFQVLTAVDDITYPKPNPEPYAHSMAALKVEPEETIVVEDSLTGARSGAAAGAYVYVIPHPNFKPEQFVNLAQVVFSFDEILNELL